MDFLADTSYKQSQAEVIGQLTAAPVATGSQLVGYSGFSTEAFVREPYSPDLDFGTGEWSAGAWVNTTARPVGGNLFTYSNDFGNAAWTKAGSTVTQQGDGSWLFVPNNGTTGTSNAISRSGVFVNGNDFHCGSIEVKAAGLRYFVFGPYYQTELNRYGNIFDTQIGAWTSSKAGDYGMQVYITALADGWYRLSWTMTPFDTALSSFYIRACAGGTYGDRATVVGDGTNGFYIRNAQYERGTAPTAYVATTSSNVVATGAVVDRAHSSDPLVSLRLDTFGRLTATAYDGTTARTVTTTAAYNTGTWLKVDTYYKTDGSLSIAVNGQQVATTGAQTPLLTLNNLNAVLTIGNNFSLNAPFPGSIALLKLSATVPTTEQLQWTYEQEKSLFSANALCVLPDASTVSDLTFDDKTNRLIAVSSANESYWSGLTRVYTEAVTSGGSLGKVVSTSNVHLVSRATVNPGVDVTLPAYNIKAHLESDRTEATIKQVVVFDFDPIDNSQTAFVLPIGYSAVAVYKAGTELRETITSAKDWSRSFDGFKETITLTTAPGTTNWIQIHAVKE